VRGGEYFPAATASCILFIATIHAFMFVSLCIVNIIFIIVNYSLFLQGNWVWIFLVNRYVLYCKHNASSFMSIGIVYELMSCNEGLLLKYKSHHALLQVLYHLVPSLS
jgi:hypothetical protein